MDRRRFLCLTLAAVAAFFLPTHSQAMVLSRSFKGTPTGQILSRSEGEGPWQVKADFGPGYHILGVYQGPGQLYARVQFREALFYLKSPDGQTWYTSEYTPPGA